MNGWRIATGAILIIHGVGHFLGIIPSFADLKADWNTESWLLSDTVSKSTTTALAIALWSLCLVGFVAAGLSLLGAGLPTDWWKPLAVGTGVLSLVTLLLFWNGFPVLFPNKLGAIAVDIVAVFGLLIANWPGDELLGL